MRIIALVAAVLVLAAVGLALAGGDHGPGRHLNGDGPAPGHFAPPGGGGTWWVIVPMALVSLGSGVVQSLITTWGLVRHYWVVMKLTATVFAAVVLMLYTRTVGHFADLASNPATGLDQLRTESFVLHSGVALVLLLGATVLGVYKPRGRTRYGWRKQQERRSDPLHAAARTEN